MLSLQWDAHDAYCRRRAAGRVDSSNAMQTGGARTIRSANYQFPRLWCAMRAANQRRGAMEPNYVYRITADRSEKQGLTAGASALEGSCFMLFVV